MLRRALTQSYHHDRDVKSLSGVLGQTQEAVLQGIFHDVFFLRPHWEKQYQRWELIEVELCTGTY